MQTIRIYVGGVDGISGELIIPEMSTLLRRQNGIGKGQDYMLPGIESREHLRVVILSLPEMDQRDRFESVGI